MATTITIEDQSTTGKTLREFALVLPGERATVRELIRERVYQEVKDYNARRSGAFRGLVRPTDAEEELNGFRLVKPRQIAWHDQFERAVEAFLQNRVLVLVDDRQVDDIEAEIELSPRTRVSFLKLTPLVGG